MSHAVDENLKEFEMLRRLGGRWAVLAAMSLAMQKKGIPLPPDITESLKIARVKIVSGCTSACEANCVLAEAEGRLFAQGPALGDGEFMMWSDLLGEAAQGKLDYARNPNDPRSGTHSPGLQVPGLHLRPGLVP